MKKIMIPFILVTAGMFFPTQTFALEKRWGEEYTKIYHTFSNIPFVKKYLIAFDDGEGNILKQELVERHNDASPPKAPVKPGHTFIGWDCSFSDVTSDLTISALFAPNVDKIDFSGKDIVYVNDYGAKGDGKTDDTDAIQAAFDDPANVNAVFIFKGTYRITKTLTVNAGSRTILPSVLAWDGPAEGENSTLLKITNDTSSPKVTVSGIKQTGGNTIIGGTLTSNHDNWAECLLWNDTYTTRISNVHFKYYNKYGILNAHTWDNWKSEDNKSAQMIVDACTFTNYNTLKENSVALAMVHTDNEIDGGNINCCDIGIGYYGGNLFVNNMHITMTSLNEARKKAERDHPDQAASDHDLIDGQGYAFDINPADGGSGNMTLSANNMYYNGAPDGIFKVSTLKCRHTIKDNNSSLIIASKNFMDPIYYLSGGKAPKFYSNGLNARAKSNVSILAIQPLESTFSDYTQFPLGNVISENTAVPENRFDIRNINNEKTMTVSGSTIGNLPDKKALRVGCLAYRTSIVTPVEAELIVGNDAYKKYIFNNSYHKLSVSAGESDLKIAYGEEKNTTVNNVNLRYRDVFIINDTGRAIGDTLMIKAASDGIRSQFFNWSLTSGSYEKYLTDISDNLTYLE